eukprot:TRINITY_DN19861_c0_g1_i1.p1 TRINITY_DN19861_c0_g1~~TRINITY_DN19861_c0_g1_i1.p1  ORF type:complete len:167 (-),score=9.61 TRINITY_DN19861_c0_g1_i1:274-774(-)
MSSFFLVYAGLLLTTDAKFRTSRGLNRGNDIQIKMIAKFTLNRRSQTVSRTVHPTTLPEQDEMERLLGDLKDSHSTQRNERQNLFHKWALFATNNHLEGVANVSLLWAKKRPLHKLNILGWLTTLSKLFQTAESHGVTETKRKNQKGGVFNPKYGCWDRNHERELE